MPSPVAGDLTGVDRERLDDALDACDYLLDNLGPQGRFRGSESWGPEGELYLSSVCRTLLDAYRIVGAEPYLAGAVLILDRMRRTQRSEGGWSLKLGKDGLAFKVTAQQRQHTWDQESLPIIGSVAYAAAKYGRLTGDQRYESMVNRAVDHLLEHWEPERGCFVETGGDHDTSLRSAPTGYQAFFLLGLSAWRRCRDDLDQIVSRLVDYVRCSFESFDAHTMPHIKMIHMALLMTHLPVAYTLREIRPRIDELIESAVFKCGWVVGGYGHRDGIRGVVTSEAHMRGTGAVARAMKLYDLTTGTRTYHDTEAYQRVSSWIDAMKAVRGYYEFQDVRDGRRKGRGSPAQYIPCQWIFGTC
jgi:hypothetical protein